MRRLWSSVDPPGSGNSESLGGSAGSTLEAVSRTASTAAGSSVRPSRSLSRRTRCSSCQVGSARAISRMVGSTACRPRSCSRDMVA
jgi:hypothetical protein